VRLATEGALQAVLDSRPHLPFRRHRVPDRPGAEVRRRFLREHPGHALDRWPLPTD